MKIVSFVFLVMQLLGYQIGLGQKIDSAYLNRLANIQSLPYRGKDGKLLGCEYSLECRDMQIVFYDITLDEKNSKIEIDGRIIDLDAKEDVKGTLPVIRIGENEYYYLKGGWYKKNTIDELIKNSYWK